MSLPTPNLDDLRFQRDLVDEARRRIIRYCPEWTDYNLSDPGITLIELFAWMTEMITYRLNQVPDKNYVKFLDLLGMQRRPASSARVDLTFWLSVSLPISPENDAPVVVPAGTEITAQQLDADEEVIFTTDRRLTVNPPKLDQLRREEDFQKNYLPRLGIEVFPAFRQEPEEGDTFYLGFDQERDIRGHILQLAFDCEATKAVGVRREDPPWVWECSMGDDEWWEIPLSTRAGERDTTGGLNNPTGRVTLYLPLTMQPNQVHGRSAFWLRCRVEQRRPEQGMYTESPRVTAISAHALGAAVPATHAVIVENEFLGTSNGEPNQSYQLEYAPLLTLLEDESVLVEEKKHGDVSFVPWTCVPDFAHSDRFDRHFTVDTATGEVQFGPAVRQPDGTVRQYGRVPEAGRDIQFTRYRYGGGVKGNVPVDSLRVLTTSLAYVSRVTNLRRAAGGRDPETMEEVQARARRELRAQLRAVTAEDYEHLAKGASRSVARVKANAPRAGSSLVPGTVEVLIVPSVSDALRSDDISRLQVDEGLAKTVQDHLDQHRLLTTILRIAEPNYIGIKVYAQIVPSEFSRPEVVIARVRDILRTFLSPLPLVEDPMQHDDLMDASWEGWPFGRDLFVAEIFSLIQRVPGVKHVLDVRLGRRTVVPAKEHPPGSEEARPPDGPMRMVESKVVRVSKTSLICSLDHEITIADLEEEDE
jgi:predicted phage baseplate assembly protein